MCSDGIVERFVNFYTDFAFKKFFGTEANKDLLISFLNALLNLQGEETIVSLTYAPVEQLPISEADRKIIYDVYCTNEKGERFVVEMQKAKQHHFKDRMLYYSTFPIQDQGRKGKYKNENGQMVSWEYELKKVYIIGIMDFELEETQDSDNVVYPVHLTMDYNNKVFNPNLNFIFIEMPKFRLEENELVTMLDKWLFAMKNLCNLLDRPQALQEAVFKKLFEIAEIAKYTKQERYDYQESLRNFRDFWSTIHTYQDIGIEIGISQGIEIGQKQGIEIGKNQGIEIGKNQGIEIGKKNEKLDMARKMKSDGMPLDVIIKYTGLSADEISDLD